MKILVTGSNGQLGSEIKLLSTKYKNDWIFTDYHEFDLNDLKNIYSKLDKFNPEIIINCAAYTSVDNAEIEKNLCNNINNIAVGHIAKWSNDNKCKLIHISSDYVFDGLVNIALKEDHETNPINYYGRTKLLGEKKCQESNIESIIIRTSWVFSSYGSNFVKKIIDLMNKKPVINVVDDQYGSPTYAADLALVIMKIIHEKSWVPGIFNFSNQGKTSWYELALIIKNFYKFETIIEPVNSLTYKSIAKRPKYSLLNKQKIKNTYQIQIPYFYDSLKKCLIILNNEK